MCEEKVFLPFLRYSCNYHALILSLTCILFVLIVSQPSTNCLRAKFVFVLLDMFMKRSLKKEIYANVIRKMNSSVSPRPLDQYLLSVLSAALTCSYVANIKHEILKSQAVPAIWRKACTILIHKKGDKNNPSNFIPIAL